MVIISGKRDFKYFMLLKLAAKKKSRKIQQRQRGGGEGAEEEGVRLSWLPTGECAHVRVHVQDKRQEQ